MPRCPWASTEPNITYHDEEWGVSVHDDRLLFEFLILEGAQAGLSWTTILKKRDNYRKAFDGFRPEKVASYGARDLQRRGFKVAGSTICYALMQATGMVNDHLVTCPRHAELSRLRYAGESRRRKTEQKATNRTKRKAHS